jgi:hypothetical protein
VVQDDKPVGLDGMRVEFDDERVVCAAGIAVVATLALRLGIEALAGELVRLRRDRPGPANAGRKVMALIYAMVLGADSIDDSAVLRAGRTGRLLGGWIPARRRVGSTRSGCDEHDRPHRRRRDRRERLAARRLRRRRRSADRRDHLRRPAADRLRTRLLGAQAELWPDWRHFCVITNRIDELALVEAEHREHAVVGSHRRPQRPGAGALSLRPLSRQRRLDGARRARAHAQMDAAARTARHNHPGRPHAAALIHPGPRPPDPSRPRLDAAPAVSLALAGRLHPRAEPHPRAPKPGLTATASHKDETAHPAGPARSSLLSNTPTRCGLRPTDPPRVAHLPRPPYNAPTSGLTAVYRPIDVTQPPHRWLLLCQGEAAGGRVAVDRDRADAVAGGTDGVAVLVGTDVCRRRKMRRARCRLRQRSASRRLLPSARLRAM